MATNMIEKATLPINVPSAPGAAGLMVDPRSNQMIYNPDGIIRYLPAQLAQVTSQVVSDQLPRTVYQSFVVPGGTLSPGRTLRVSHFGQCAANANAKLQSIEVNQASPVVIATTGSVVNNGGSFYLQADLIIVSPTSAIGTGTSVCTRGQSIATYAPATIDITQPLFIGFTSTNIAVGDTTHGGYVVVLVG